MSRYYVKAIHVQASSGMPCDADTPLGAVTYVRTLPWFTTSGGFLVTNRETEKEYAFFPLRLHAALYRQDTMSILETSQGFCATDDPGAFYG